MTALLVESNYIGAQASDDPSGHLFGSPTYDPARIGDPKLYLKITNSESGINLLINEDCLD